MLGWLGTKAGNSSAIAGYKSRGAAAEEQIRRGAESEREAAGVQDAAREMIAQLARRPLDDREEASTEAVLDDLSLALELQASDEWTTDDIQRMQEGAKVDCDADVCLQLWDTLIEDCISTEVARAVRREELIFGEYFRKPNGRPYF